MLFVKLTGDPIESFDIQQGECHQAKRDLFSPQKRTFSCKIPMERNHHCIPEDLTALHRTVRGLWQHCLSYFNFSLLQASHICFNSRLNRVGLFHPETIPPRLKNSCCRDPFRQESIDVCATSLMTIETVFLNLIKQTFVANTQ
jgi:hypothetical protein